MAHRQPVGRPRSIATWLVALTLTMVIAPLAAADFAMAGGNAQRTGFVDAPGPTAEPEVAWTYALGVVGESNTQPVLDSDGNLYVTAAPARRSTWDESQGEPQGVLLSLTSYGAERWRYTWTWDYDDPAWQGSWSQLSGPVVTPDGRVVMGHRQGFLRCWDKDTGALRWERDVSPGWNPITSSPVVDRAGNVYVHCRDIPTIHKIDAAGRDVWVHRFVDGESGHTASPTLSSDEETLYIGRSTEATSYLYAIDATDGTYKWAWSPETSHNHSFSWSIPVAGDNGTVYIQDESLGHVYAVQDIGATHAHRWSGRLDGRDAPRLLALNEGGLYTSHVAETPRVDSYAREGDLRWSRTLEKGSGVGGLLVSRDALYFGVNGTGTVYALNPADGKTLWQKQVVPGDGAFSEGLTLSPEGVLYVPVSGTPARPEEPAIVALSQGTVQERGFANRWLICGPFDNVDGAGHDQIYGPEFELDFTSTYFGINDTLAEWQTNRTPNYQSFVSFRDEYRSPGAGTAYAVCWVRNDGPPKDVVVGLESSDSLKLYLDDERMWEVTGSVPERMVQHRVALRLPTGQSSIMVKVSQIGERWGFRFRVSEPGSNVPPADVVLSDIPIEAP